MDKRILIDTDVLIEYVKGNLELPYTQVFITEITLYEFIRGTKDIKRAKKILEESFNVIFHDNTIIQKASEIWASLKKSGQLIDDRDLLIAATSITNDLPLMTRNKKHFERLKAFGLKLFD